MRLNCFHCDQAFEATAEQLGTVVTCPHCRKQMRLPSTVAAGAPQVEEKGGFRAWLRGSLSGMLSFAIHFCLMLSLSLVTCDYRGDSGRGEEVFIGELASQHLSDIDKGELDPGEPEVSNPQQEQLDESFEEVAPPDPASEGDLVEIQSLQLAPSGASGGTPEIGAVSSGGGALGEGASFMGVHARGKRFCIIADRSGSMAGPKLEYVKQEILEALTSMKKGSRFQLIFFNHGATPFPQTGWRHPDKDRAAVEEWLRGIVGEGGTVPTPAFEVAFALQPRPDVIFFMTDGLFDPATVDQVAATNRMGEKRVVIHTISFRERSAEQLLRRIAKDSGGTYRHVAGF